MLAWKSAKTEIHYVKFPAVILVLWCAVFIGSAAQESGPVSPPGGAICGFIAGPHYSYEDAQVKQVVSVNLLAGDARIDQPITLRFFVNEKPRGVPVDSLQVEHEKLMHIIGIRDDLSEFFHIHPLRVAPGLWEVTHTFTRG